MFKIHIFVYFCVQSICSALDDPKEARIVHYEFDNIGTGPYHFSYETSDGTKREERGEVHYPNTEDEVEVVTGSFSFISSDGIVYTVRYKADDQGFHPEGDHIKVPPFVPWIHHRRQQDATENSKSETATQPYYETGERVLNAFRTAPVLEPPTPQYLPSASTEVTRKIQAPALILQENASTGLKSEIKPKPEITVYSGTVI